MGYRWCSWSEEELRTVGNTYKGRLFCTGPYVCVQRRWLLNSSGFLSTRHYLLKLIMSLRHLLDVRAAVLLLTGYLLAVSLPVSSLPTPTTTARYRKIGSAYTYILYTLIVINIHRECWDCAWHNVLCSITRSEDWTQKYSMRLTVREAAIYNWRSTATARTVHVMQWAIKNGRAWVYPT